MDLLNPVGQLSNNAKLLNLICRRNELEIVTIWFLIKINKAKIFGMTCIIYMSFQISLLY